MDSAASSSVLRSDFWDGQKWGTHLQITSSMGQARILAAARRPFGSVPILAAWFYDVDMKCISTVEFIEAPLNPTSDVVQTIAEALHNIVSFFSDGVARSADPLTCEDCPTWLEPMLKILDYDPNDVKLYSHMFSKAHVFFLFDTPRAKASQSLSMYQIMNFVYDLYLFQGELHSCSPIRYFVQSLLDQDGSGVSLYEFFSGPRNFVPNNEFSGAAFWPWQQCVRLNKSGGVSIEEIETVSVVLDIRQSTRALLLYAEPWRFSDFLRNVIVRTRDIALGHGGFFDKETGDGIIVHFPVAIGSRQYRSGETACSEAIQAALHMLKEVSALCEEQQRFLRHKLVDFEPSIGVHLDKAVWITDQRQVRAIGKSVVEATRLCSASRAKEILLSNAVFSSLEVTHPDELKDKGGWGAFGLRTVKLKEHAGVRLGVHSLKLWGRGDAK